MVQKALFVLHIALAITGGNYLVKGLGHVFDQNNWAVFHSCGLSHGSIFLAGPIFCAICYLLLWTVPLFKANIKQVKFIQSQSGLVRIIPDPLVFAMAFGPFYYLTQGMWDSALKHLAICIFTFGWAWAILALYAGEDVYKHLQKNGWQRS